MNDLAGLLTPPSDDTAPFPPSSRHHGSAVKTATLPDGRIVSYVARRFTPPRDGIEITDTHRVQEGDRLDLLAAAHFGDPTLGWRILDANGILDPREALAERGALLQIGLPARTPGRSHG